MKRILAAASLAAVMGATSAQAETNYMIGATFSLGGGTSDMGISARIMLPAGGDFALGGGVTYYMSSGTIGYDAMAAYLSGNIAAGMGYDFATSMPVFSLGYYQATQNPG